MSDDTHYHEITITLYDDADIEHWMDGIESLCRCDGTPIRNGDCDFITMAVHRRRYDEPDIHEQLAKMRDALEALQSWDMLTLTPDGKGDVCGDAPWARQLIAEALA